MRNAAFLLVALLTAACGGGETAHSATDSAPSPTAANPAAAVPANSAPTRSTPSNPAEPPAAFEATVLPDYAIDTAIPTAVRKAIHAEQDRLIAAVRNDDPAVLTELFAPGLLPESPRDARKFFDNFRQQLQDAKIEPWHDVYVEPKSTAPIFVETGGADNVRIAIPGAGPKVYTSLQQIRGDFRDGLLAAIWVERAEGWRLLSLRVGALRLNGKAAAEWYAEAKALADKGQRLPAWLRLTVADDLLESVPFVSYPHTEDARALQARLGRDLAAEHSFPLTLAGIPTAPQVVRIDPTFLQGSLSPVVHFVTKLNLQDSGLANEAQEVANALAGLYPGFCHEVTRVALAAYNEIPSDPSRKYPSAAFAANCPPS